MKIKQQKHIKAFLEKEFGKPKGNSLLEEQEQILSTLIENIKNKSKNQKKTLVQTILQKKRNNSKTNLLQLKKKTRNSQKKLNKMKRITI